jgi:SAM-dependent methyltransferase
MARDPYSWTDKGVQRRCISFSGFRLDGLGDLLPRAFGASVLDIGCNRGHVSHDLMGYGATVLHGCDIDPDVIRHANELFADYRHVEAKFEVVDLKGGAGAIKKAFGEKYRREYDIVLFLAIYHKLRRIMDLPAVLHLVDHLAHHCGRFFVWRGSRDEPSEFESTLTAKGFKRVHYSEISECAEMPGETWIRQQPAGIWAKTDAV